MANGRSQLKSYGSSFTWDGSKYITESTKYAKVYEHDTTKDNVEIKDLVISVEAIDFNGEIHTFSNEDCNFEYRKNN